MTKKINPKSQPTQQPQSFQVATEVLTSPSLKIKKTEKRVDEDEGQATYQFQQRIREQLSQLPQLPGVYRFYDTQENLLYVGKARDLKKRVSSYFLRNLPSPRIARMVEKIANLQTTTTRSEAEALILENNLIKQLKPRFNILFRDDKSYPYLKMTSEIYPRIAYYRGATDKVHDYFGPYPNAWAVKESIQLLQRIFKLRHCEDAVFHNRTRPCLLHQIHRCSAPCVNLVSVSDYQRDVDNAKFFLQGKSSELMEDLQQRMQMASEQLAFEKAAELRDQITSLSTILHRQSMESARENDLDVIAIKIENGMVCVNLAMIRGGRHLGDKAYFPHHFDEEWSAWNESDEHNDSNENDKTNLEQHVLHRFMAQHYVEQTVPPIILSNVAVNQAELMRLLSQQTGYAIQFITQTKLQRKIWLEMAVKSCERALEQKQNSQSLQNLRVAALINTLEIDLDNMDDLRIECFDVSHSHGEATQASCVVFHKLVMQNAAYRRFNIHGITGGDDYAAMRQVLFRRYEGLQRQDNAQMLELQLQSEEHAPDKAIATTEVAQIESSYELPHIVLIDGGKGQIESAKQVFMELGLNISVLVGVAKGEGRKVGLETLIFADGRPSKELGAQSHALMLIAQIRDEAHRFAITGMRKKRAAKRQQSSIEEIEGIGSKRRQKLLARFGSVKGIENASIEDLANVEGISKALAEKIYQQLHG